jgi:hypothetical protein
VLFTSVHVLPQRESSMTTTDFDRRYAAGQTAATLQIEASLLSCSPPQWTLGPLAETALYRR